VADQLEPTGEIPETTLEFRSRRLLMGLFFACFGAEILIVLLDYHLNYRQHIDIDAVRHLFNGTREDSVGSWFSVTQTALVAVTLWIVWLTARAQERAWLVRLGWLILAIWFSYMTFDDGSKFHERMGSTFKAVQRDASAAAGEDTAGQKALKFFPSYSWQVVFLPLFATMGLLTLGFLWHQLGDWRGRAMLVIGLSCFVVAVGMDFIEGLDRDHEWNLWRIWGDREWVDDFSRDRFRRDGYTAIRHFGKTVEESTEMLGTTLIWLSILRHWMQRAPKLNLRFRS
jgi:hypothetical protein